MYRTIMAALSGVILAAGCTQITPAGLLAAARLDPVETPPEAIAVAISVPDSLRLRDGDATLLLAFAPQEGSGAAPVMAKVPLDIAPGGTGPQPSQEGDRVYVLGFSADAAARLAAVQAEIRALRAQDVAGTGTLSIDVAGGCLTRALGAEGLAVATWLRTDPQGDFVALSRRVDLFEVIPPEERAALESRLVPC